MSRVRSPYGSTMPYQDPRGDSGYTGYFQDQGPNDWHSLRSTSFAKSHYNDFSVFPETQVHYWGLTDSAELATRPDEFVAFAQEQEYDWDTTFYPVPVTYPGGIQVVQRGSNQQKRNRAEPKSRPGIFMRHLFHQQSH